MHRVLLTSGNPELFTAVERACPGIAVTGLAPDNLPAAAGGQAWCFIDWLLPQMSGIELCRQLRALPATAASHITMILDDDDPVSRRRALSAGADDYLPGPVTPDALVERLRRYFADRPGGGEPAIASNPSGLSLDAQAHQVRWQGKLVTLRPREIALLQVFLANPDRLMTRDKLISLAGRNCEIADERTVDVWVGRLRRSLEAQGVPRIVRTVRSHGYVFDTPELT